MWVAGGDADGGWLTGGTFLVARRITIHIETWDRTSLDEQELVIGRDKAGHATEAAREAVTVGPLRTPLPRASVTSPPRLSWHAAAASWCLGWPGRETQPVLRRP